MTPALQPFATLVRRRGTPRAAATSEDLESLDRLLSWCEWKAAAAIGCAVLEVELATALEAWGGAAREFGRLQRRRHDDGARWEQPIHRWGLYGLTVAAVHFGIIEGSEAELVHSVRKARNALHEGATVSRAAAEGARAAVVAVLERVPHAVDR